MDDKDKILDKWAPLLDKIGVEDDKKDWLSQYAELQSTYDGSTLATQPATQSSIFSGLVFPLVRRVQASLLGGDPALLEAAKNKVTAVNRERQIEDIIDDKVFVPLDIKDTEEYKEYQKGGLVSVVPMSGPTGVLYYMDFVYKPIKNKRKFRRPGYYSKLKEKRRN